MNKNILDVYKYKFDFKRVRESDDINLKVIIKCFYYMEVDI